MKDEKQINGLNNKCTSDEVLAINIYINNVQNPYRIQNPDIRNISTKLKEMAIRTTHII